MANREIYIDKSLLGICKGKCRLEKESSGMYRLFFPVETEKCTPDRLNIKGIKMWFDDFEYSATGKDFSASSDDSAYVGLKKLREIIDRKKSSGRQCQRTSGTLPPPSLKPSLNALSKDDADIKEVLSQYFVTFDKFLDAVLGDGWEKNLPK